MNVLTLNGEFSSIQFTNVANASIIYSLRNATNTGIGIQISTLNGADANTARLTITSGVNTAVVSITNSNLKVTGLAGAGNAFACLDSNGQFYRSAVACV